MDILLNIIIQAYYQCFTTKTRQVWELTTEVTQKKGTVFILGKTWIGGNK